jgi:hypothetical protein
MKRFYASVAVIVAVCGGVWFATAHAAPPTVTPSPGYDARLQEQRNGPVVYQPDARYRRPVPRRRWKRIYDGPH